MDTKINIEEDCEEMCTPEECVKEVRVTHCYLTSDSPTRDLCNIAKLIECEKFSKL